MNAEIISVIGVVVSAFAIFISFRASKEANGASKEANRLSGYYNGLVERNNQFVSGQTELLLNQTIGETKRHLVEVTFRLSELSNRDENQVEQLSDMLGTLLKSAQENHLNAYESACGLYLDNKIDKIRFKKLYILELRQLVTGNVYQEFFYPDIKSSYQAILKVYKEWNNLE
ncbi:hypothetical protein [Paenibacillus amylolyticus]|uniref:hypothetical protein n=1 Tax=Paenibacillus amylolyticus TaxID=1451 RepID=UPI00249B1C14|nr:hypothetical protein [Paenibacillus amylolyticus]WFA88039.1 hypothetical protein OGI70_14465 [Paenibacillus amylolyticus]